MIRFSNEDGLVSHKKRRNEQKYRVEYTQEWPCLIKSTLSENHVYCTVCSCNFSVLHGGRDDCRRHIVSKKHVDYAKRRNETRSITTFFNNKGENAVINAEVFFSRFLIEHNIALQASDHAGMLFRKMFPDSEIAKKYGSGRTKTTAIVQCMAEERKKSVAAVLENSGFSIATDASNDVNDTKFYPLVVTYYNKTNGQVSTVLLSLLESIDSTGKGIFNLLNNELEKLNLKWENCVSFACDNASNMIGKFKGVAAFIEKEYPHVKVIGCPCHLIHRAVQKATKESLPVDIEMLIIQIFFYLEKSSKRKHQLILYQQLCGEKTHKILKHVNTRWLSLENCLNRVIEQWEPLQCFFNSNEVSSKDKSAQFDIVSKMINDPVTKLYALFLSNIMPVFSKINLALQQEKPGIHVLKQELQSLFFELIIRFVKPSAVSKAETVLLVNYQKSSNQKNNEDLVIGSKTRISLNGNDFSDETKEQFFSSVKKFFCVSCDYVKKKFPLEDDFIHHAEVMDITKRCSAHFKSVKYFLDRYQNMFGEISLDSLEVEFASYQVEKFSTDIIESDRADEAWHKISMIQSSDGTKKYRSLPKIMLAILTTPQSNAATERIFSMVRKNQTEFRSSLGLKTMESLLIEKLAMKNCYDKTFTQDELQKAKSATSVQKEL